MPELPEVETVKNGLTHLVGTTIKQIIVRFPKLRYPLDQVNLAKTHNQVIKAITRRAKYLLFELESGNYIVIHLGMSGKITSVEQNTLIKKHDHVDILVDNFIIRYNDPRRFGCIICLNNLNTSTLFSKLGPEPLSEDFNPNYLYSKIRNTSIKQLIMDNSIVVGVGNIYACESLFLAKISPLRKANSLSKYQIKILVENIKMVLRLAIELGGSSLRDYKNTKGELGYFQKIHNVYAKAKQKCKLCDSIINEVRIGQRNSFYCPSCQT